MAGIWTFGENRDQTLELLTAGKELATAFGTTLAAFASDGETASDYVAHGADDVFVLPPVAEDQLLESLVPVIVDAAAEGDPDVFLFAATPRGKEIATRVASRLNATLCSGCTGFTVDREKKLLSMNRMLYGGLAVQTVVSAARPQMATIAPRTFAPAEVQEGHTGSIQALPPAPPSHVKLVARTPKVSESVDITEAKTIVCVGRGVSKQEDVAIARELATIVEGEVACSRPVAEELHWLPEEVYLGISGKTVRPGLYIGLGVSGQIQHVTGIRDSKVIVAINKDENAPIFDAADYGIVGDLYQALPLLVQELKSALKK